MDMKVFLTGQNLENIGAMLKARGAELCDSGDEADIIVAHGGDGAFLSAERDFPRRLKYPIRDSENSSALSCSFDRKNSSTIFSHAVCA